MTAQELKAAILDLAIRGKLVPQDPNDEPADKLLERISEVGSCVPRDRKSATRGRSGRATLPPITDDEKPFDLPNGWAWCHVSDISDKISDGEHKTPRRCKSFCGYYLLSARNICDNKVLLADVDYVDEVEYGRISARCNPTYGDVLISCSGSIGRTACVEDDNKYAMVRSAAMIRCSLAYPRYVMYCLQSQFIQRQFMDKVKKSVQKNLFLGAIASTVLPLPPLAEQKRIVERIEELMPWVERYAAAEEKRGKLDAALPGQLKQSILKAAFAGTMVADCVGVEKTLDSVCAGVFTGNSLSDLEKRKFTRPDGLPFVGTKDVGFDQIIAYDNGIRIPTSEDGYRIAPKGSTLLCVEGGSSGRKIGLLTEDVRFGNKLCAFVPGDDLDSRYLFLFLQSPQFLEQFVALQNGPRKGAGVSQVKGLSIPMLPLAKQKALVRRIDDFLSLIQKM